MGILIDASVLIAAERGQLDVDRLLATSGGEEVALSAITAAELLHGIHRAPGGKLRTQREAFVERLLERLPVLPFDLVTARIHARVWAERKWFSSSRFTVIPCNVADGWTARGCRIE
jgi:tRNA(fMet)-specific endonuclease VapC